MTPIRPNSSDPGNDNAVPEGELQAYVDGQLGDRRRGVIEAYLATRPDEAARLSAYRRQNIGLHALFDAAPLQGSHDAPTPQHLTALATQLDAELHAETTRKRQRPLALRALAASVAIMLSAGTAGWLALDHVNSGGSALVNLTRQAAEAQLQPVTATQANGAASGERQVVAWLVAQPGDVPTTVPDLEALGFRLSGERLVTTADGRPAAQLLYSDKTGQRVTLTMRSGGKAGQTSFTFARDGAAARFFWQDAHMAYSLTGAMAQKKLLQIAETVSASLRKGPPDIPQQETTGTAPEIPETPGARTLPLPVTPTPDLDKTPLMPIPASEAGDTPKET